MHYRTIALATTVALLAWTLGLPAMVHNANAAALEFFSDTISDSDFGVDATHTLKFDTVTAMTGDQVFRIYFDEASTSPAFDFTNVTAADLVSVNSSGFTPAVDCTGVETDKVELTVNTTEDYIEGTVCTGDTVPAGTITFAIDGANRINNPSFVGSYVISLQGYGATPIADSGDTRIVIIDDVTVTADVDTIFNFTILGVATGTLITGEPELTSGTSYPTSIPFYTLAPGVEEVMAQTLQVDTNALNGFSVSVYADQTLTSGNAATINPFIDAPDSGGIATPTLWTGPSDTIGLIDTYGHWGLTSDDTVVSSTTAPGMWESTGVRTYAGNFIGVNNPVEVFYHNLPVKSSGGTGIGSTVVAYKAEIGYLQEAAKDYTATLTYIATPVF